MEAKFYEQGEVTVVTLSGRLQIEKAHVFRDACLKNFSGKKVVFSMEKLSFVGSTGIQSFFQIIRDFNAANVHSAKIVGLNADFLRLLNFSGQQGLEFCENIDGALSSFQVPHLVIS